MFEHSSPAPSIHWKARKAVVSDCNWDAKVTLTVISCNIGTGTQMHPAVRSKVDPEIDKGKTVKIKKFEN